MTDTASGPLSGTLVVDLSRALAGPHATMMLGDLGARVIKVETPGTGDDTRGWGPPFVRDAKNLAMPLPPLVLAVAALVLRLLTL
jgi:crotonobetainyl-CoA:carnitine CoA-transferase CaiB-like acyl-CoA transferase